jgi:hypothetical protein
MVWCPGVRIILSSFLRPHPVRPYPCGHLDPMPTPNPSRPSGISSYGSSSKSIPIGGAIETSHPVASIEPIGSAGSDPDAPAFKTGLDHFAIRLCPVGHQFNLASGLSIDGVTHPRQTTTNHLSPALYPPPSGGRSPWECSGH